MLQNRIYRGEITHKGISYPGEHPAIIDQSLWGQVQAVLAENRIELATGVHAKLPSLLAGLLFDEAGQRLTPTYAVKKGARYRYYVSTALITGTRKDRASGRRIPAGNLEDLVISRLRAFFTDPGAVLDAVNDESDSGLGPSQLIERGRQVAEEFESGAPNEIKATLVTLACRVAINPDRLEINMCRHRLGELLAGRSIGLTKQDRKRTREADDIVKLVVPVQLKRVGREMRMFVENSDGQTAADPGLLRIIARAHDFQTRLIHNAKLTVHDIARDERVTAAYVYTLLRLPWLAPDITSNIVNGRQPQQLNAKTLMRQASRLPASWAAQRSVLGFR
jgi:site-specific DNA recombinase